MGIFNTFFNWRTAHHTKNTTRAVKAQTRTMTGSGRTTGGLIMAGVAAGQRSRAYTEASKTVTGPGWYPCPSQDGMVEWHDGLSWSGTIVGSWTTPPQNMPVRVAMWRPDPQQPGMWRWWDGRQYTDLTEPMA